MGAHKLVYDSGNSLFVHWNKAEDIITEMPFALRNNIKTEEVILVLHFRDEFRKTFTGPMESSAFHNAMVVFIISKINDAGVFLTSSEIKQILIHSK